MEVGADVAAEATGDAAQCQPGAPCDDRDPCTIDDQCGDGGACAGAPRDCSDGVDCTKDVCDKDTGECASVPAAPGCCTQEADCIPADPGPCDAWTCDVEAHACQFAPLAGCCQTDEDCDDATECTQDFCDGSGNCHNDAVVTACDDGDPCTLGDLCVDGKCAAGFDVPSCDDGNPCTDDTCAAFEGCQSEYNTAACDDGNPCTQEDTCNAGACKAGENTCGCKNDGECAGEDDGNPCTGTLFCDTSTVPAQCVVKPGSQVDCSVFAAPDCKDYVCDPQSGDCITVPAGDGNACDDWNPCTAGDICFGGVCAGVTVPACGIGIPCASFLDCNPGLTCFDAMPGGYCTKLDCLVVGCPAGTVCHKLAEGDLAVCLAACDSDDDCRVAQGYGCNEDKGCWCGPDICTANQMGCLGNVAAMCNSCGSAFEPGGTDCALQGLVCKQGACVPCEPSCTGKACGPDGCGGSCGKCSYTLLCDEPSGHCYCPCPNVNEPVCDTVTGTTYASACKAECSGVTQVAPGACPPPPGVCTVEAGGPKKVGEQIVPFACTDLNDKSPTYQQPVTSDTLKTKVWIAYCGNCGG